MSLLSTGSLDVTGIYSGTSSIIYVSYSAVAGTMDFYPVKIGFIWKLDI